MRINLFNQEWSNPLHWPCDLKENDPLFNLCHDLLNDIDNPSIWTKMGYSFKKKWDVQMENQKIIYLNDLVLSIPAPFLEPFTPGSSGVPRTAITLTGDKGADFFIKKYYCEEDQMPNEEEVVLSYALDVLNSIKRWHNAWEKCERRLGERLKTFMNMWGNHKNTCNSKKFHHEEQHALLSARSGQKTKFLLPKFYSQYCYVHNRPLKPENKKREKINSERPADNKREGYAIFASGNTERAKQCARETGDILDTIFNNVKGADLAFTLLINNFFQRSLSNAPPGEDVLSETIKTCDDAIECVKNVYLFLHHATKTQTNLNDHFGHSINSESS
ncbi:MAG: hypothetical protein ACMUJM_20555 [bacterium]